MTQPAPTRQDAYERARVLFRQGERIEVGLLADEVGVNRVTLYRWLGSRETLLAALLWERLEHALERSDSAARSDGRTGVDRLVDVLMGIFPSPGSTSVEAGFIAREPALAMRLMTTGEVHEKLIAWFAAAVAEERDAGLIAPAHPAEQIAEIVVKSGEAVFWFDVASGRGVNRDNVEVILRALCPPA